jgi:hypothetical protein
MTEATVDIQENTPNPDYTLSLEDFLNPPTNIEKYHDGDTITRGNFVSYINTSFAISMGFPDAQRYYFQWLDDHEGFDTATAVRNFLSAGGVETLTAEEKISIVDSFNNVKKHGRAIRAENQDSSDEAIVGYFQNQVEEIVNPTKRFIKNPFQVPSTELKTMSLGELKSKIKIHAKANTKYK